MPRRCRPKSARSVAGLAQLAGVSVFCAILALCPTPGQAQTAPANTQTAAADPDADLFLPSLQGSPNNPSRFMLRNNAVTADQAPPAGAFTGPAVLPAPPVYGSPTGFGASNTGFNSSNSKRKPRPPVANGGTAIVPPQETTTFDPVPAPPPEVPSRPPTPAPPLPPEIYPSRAAQRPGAALPPPPDQLPISNPPAEVHPLTAASRPGAVLPIPPPLDVSSPASAPPPGTPIPGTLPLGAVPRPTLPFIGGDPYEALGMRAGSFIVLPAVELSAGYDNNPQHTPGGPGSSTFIVAPELHARSDWASNSLTADIVGSYYWYGNDTFQPSLNRPYLNSKIDGRLDVTRDTHILLENRFIISTDNPGSPNIQANLAKLPIDTTVGGTVGVEQQFSRFDATLKGTIDRTTYQNSHFTDGETANNDDRAYDQYAGIFRLAYEIDPGFKPFVEVSQDKRNYDSPVDFFGEDRSSTGSSAKFGGEFKLGSSMLVGEMAVGYLQRNYEDPTLPNIAGMTLDGSLLWLATGLTSVKFTATSQVYESTLQGVSGSFSRDVSVEVDHALRRWLIATGTFGYGHDDYVGELREDDRYYGIAGLVYKLNPYMQLKAQLRHDWLTSTQSGNAYQATSVLLTLRLQR